MDDEEAHWAYHFHLLNEFFESYVFTTDDDEE
jgi:hypothetical protein